MRILITMKALMTALNLPNETTKGALKEKLRRLMVTQDTGSAIRGPVRGDLFWGHGAEAARKAGHMKSRGRYYLLLPRTLASGQGGGETGS